VGDTSFADDRYTNLQLWGHAGIPEAWLVDITAQRVVLFRAPHAEECQDQDQMGSGDVVSPGAFPDRSLSPSPLWPHIRFPEWRQRRCAGPPVFPPHL